MITIARIKEARCPDEAMLSELDRGESFEVGGQIFIILGGAKMSGKLPCLHLSSDVPETVWMIGELRIRRLDLKVLVQEVEYAGEIQTQSAEETPS